MNGGLCAAQRRLRMNNRMKMEFDACRDETRHALRDYDFWNEELNRRSAGDSMTANRVEAELLIFGEPQIARP